MLGPWLIFSHFVFDYKSDALVASDTISGALIIIRSVVFLAWAVIDSLGHTVHSSGNIRVLYSSKPDDPICTNNKTRL